MVQRFFVSISKAWRKKKKLDAIAADAHHPDKWAADNYICNEMLRAGYIYTPSSNEGVRDAASYDSFASEEQLKMERKKRGI